MSYRSTWDGRSGYSGKRHTLRNLLLVLLALGILCFGVLEGLIYSGARTRVTGEPGVMVVFGCKVNRDGPGAMLKDRLDTVLDYLEDHPETTVVLSGGKGDDEHVSEARGMYDYLVANGADGERLWMEGNSRNTWQNVNYTLELMEEKDLNAGNGVVLVSSGFHLTRIKMLWSRAGGTANVSTLAAPTSSLYTTVHMFFREPLALVKSFVFDR